MQRLRPPLPNVAGPPKVRWARNQLWDTHVGPAVLFDLGGRDRLASVAESNQEASLLSQGKWASRGTPTLAVQASNVGAIGTLSTVLLAETGFVSGKFGQWRSLQVRSDQTLRWAGHLARQLEAFVQSRV